MLFGRSLLCLYQIKFDYVFDSPKFSKAFAWSGTPYGEGSSSDSATFIGRLASDNERAKIDPHNPCNKFTMSGVALLAIDLQRDFLEANGRQSVGPERAARVIETSNRLVKHAAVAGWQTIFIKNEFSKNDWFGNLLRGGSAIQGSAGAEMDPRVMVPENAPMIRKNKASAFTNPALEDLLKKSAIRQVIVLGVMTEACVRATAKAARSRALQVTLVSDAVASRFEWLHRVGLIAMRKAGVEIKSSIDIMAP